MSASRLYQKDSLMSGIPNKVVSDKPVFSLHHPMVPKRYVPEWQMDMKNRKLIAMNCIMANNKLRKGHVSYFLCGRERLCATDHRLYENILNYSRTLHSNTSHFSRYNSGLRSLTLS